MKGKDRDWTAIIIGIIVLAVVTVWIIVDRYERLRKENVQLRSGMVTMDSLLTIYQTQLTACRVDRDELGSAVVGLFNAVEVRR